MCRRTPDDVSGRENVMFTRSHAARVHYTRVCVCVCVGAHAVNAARKENHADTTTTLARLVNICPPPRYPPTPVYADGRSLIPL